MNILCHRLRWRPPSVRMAIALIALISCLLAVAVQADRVPTTGGQGAEKLPKIFNYELYLDKYHKPAGGASPVKLLARVQLFVARTLQIFKHNVLYAKRAAGHYLHQNMFTDLTVREITRRFVSMNSGLQPVVGARVHPNMPADEYVAQLRRERHEVTGEEDKFVDVPSEISDGYSQADLSSLDSNDRADSSSVRTNPETGSVNFLNEQQANLDVRSIMSDLELDSRAVRRVARLLEPEGKTIESKMIKDEMQRVEAARRMRGIVQAPFIEPTNRNFDPSLLPSQGLISSFAGYVTGGIYGEDDDEDEEEEERTKFNITPEQAEEQKKSFLSSLVNSLSDYLFEDYEIIDHDDHDQDDDDEFEDARESFDSAGSSIGAENKPGEIVYDVDWRQTGCVSRPKHQINCNSCYAFATLDMMEFFHCRQKKTLTEFSAQYIIDCGRKAHLNGCQGGKLSHVGLFIKAYGIQLNAVYPYEAIERQCPFDEVSDREQKSFALKPTITGWRMFDEITAWYKWLPKTPIVVGINMPSDFLAYGGGIHDGLDCVEGMVHAMFLVGSGKQDGKPFWLLKNSFSSEWGEAGYFRLSKRAPMRCFNSAIVARANF